MERYADLPAAMGDRDHPVAGGNINIGDHEAAFLVELVFAAAGVGRAGGDPDGSTGVQPPGMAPGKRLCGSPATLAPATGKPSRESTRTRSRDAGLLGHRASGEEEQA